MEQPAGRTGATAGLETVKPRHHLARGLWDPGHHRDLISGEEERGEERRGETHRRYHQYLSHRAGEAGLARLLGHQLILGEAGLCCTVQ